MSTLTRTARRSVLFALALTLMLAVAACGSSSNDKSTSSAQSKPTASAAAGVPAYQGAEQKFIGTLPPAQQKQGASPTIGFLQVFGGQQVLVATQKAFTDEIKSLGGKVTVLDAKLDPQKQVSQFDQLFAQGVDAIAVMPANVDAIQRSLQEAKKRKIPVVGFQDPVDLSQPPNKYLVTTVNAGYDYAAYKTMGDLAQKSPKSTFAILGSAIPNSSLQFITDRIKFWGERLGLKFVGRQDSKTDLPTGMAPAAQAILTRYPDVKNIVAYNDQAALAAIAAAREAGKLDGIKVATTNSGQDVAGQAIKQGRMQSGYYVPWAELGKLMARAAYNAATKQATNMPNAVVPKSNLVTKANVDQFSFFH